jgi:hypothetical protein
MGSAVLVLLLLNYKGVRKGRLLCVASNPRTECAEHVPYVVPGCRKGHLAELTKTCRMHKHILFTSKAGKLGWGHGFPQLLTHCSQLHGLGEVGMEK